MSNPQTPQGSQGLPCSQSPSQTKVTTPTLNQMQSPNHSTIKSKSSPSQQSPFWPIRCLLVEQLNNNSNSNYNNKTITITPHLPLHHHYNNNLLPNPHTTTTTTTKITTTTTTTKSQNNKIIQLYILQGLITHSSQMFDTEPGAAGCLPPRVLAGDL